MNKWIRLYAATEAENQQIALQVFKNRNDKLEKPIIFDPDIVLADIKRWQYQKKKQNAEVKPSITDYKDHTELHQAMASFPSKQEKELASEEDAKAGSKLIFEESPFKVYKATTPAAVSRLAEGSNWCVQNTDTAKDYLKKYKFFIARKNDEPLVAVLSGKGGVWFKNDYNLRGGTSYSNASPVVLREDFEFINKLLEKLGMPLLSNKSPKGRTIFPIVKDQEKAMLSVYRLLKTNPKGAIERLNGVLPKGTRSPEFETKILKEGSASDFRYYAKDVIKGKKEKVVKGK